MSSTTSATSLSISTERGIESDCCSDVSFDGPAETLSEVSPDWTVLVHAAEPSPSAIMTYLSEISAIFTNLVTNFTKTKFRTLFGSQESCHTTMFIYRQVLLLIVTHSVSTSYAHEILQSELKLLYCAVPAWSGFCSSAGFTQLNLFRHRCKKLEYYEREQETISDTYYADLTAVNCCLQLSQSSSISWYHLQTISCCFGSSWGDHLHNLQQEKQWPQD